MVWRKARVVSLGSERDKQFRLGCCPPHAAMPSTHSFATYLNSSHRRLVSQILKNRETCAQIIINNNKYYNSKVLLLSLPTNKFVFE